MQIQELIEDRLYKVKNCRSILFCKEDGIMYSISLLNGYVRRIDTLEDSVDFIDYGKNYKEVF